MASFHRWRNHTANFSAFIFSWEAFAEVIRDSFVNAMPLDLLQTVCMYTGNKKKPVS